MLTCLSCEFLAMIGPWKGNYTELCYCPNPLQFVLLKSHQTGCLTGEIVDYWKCVSSIAIQTMELLDWDFQACLQEGVKAFLLNFRKLLLVDNFLYFPSRISSATAAVNVPFLCLSLRTISLSWEMLQSDINVQSWSSKY